jgi:hypothetical protein
MTEDRPAARGLNNLEGIVNYDNLIRGKTSKNNVK